MYKRSYLHLKNCVGPFVGKHTQKRKRSSETSDVVIHGECELTEAQWEEYKINAVNELEKQLNYIDEDELRVAEKEFAEHEKKEKKEKILSDLDKIAAEYDQLIADIKRHEGLQNNAPTAPNYDVNNYSIDNSVFDTAVQTPSKYEYKTRLQTLKDKIKKLQNRIVTRSVAKKIEKLKEHQEPKKKRRLHGSGGGLSKKIKKTTRRRRSVRRCRTMRRVK
jgi:hypothetical protein